MNISTNSVTTCVRSKSRRRSNLGLIVVCLTPIFAFACSSNSSSSADSEEESVDMNNYSEHQGIFTAAEMRVNDQRELSLSAGFATYETRAFPVHSAEDFCGFREEVESAGMGGQLRALPPFPISAGSLIVSNAAGTLATLNEPNNPNSDYEQYTHDNIVVTGEQTTSMSLDITGDVFPSMQSIAIHEVDSPSGIEPALGTVFESTANTVKLNQSQYDNTFLSMEIEVSIADSRYVYDCRAFDDGEINLADFFRSEYTDISIRTMTRHRNEQQVIDNTRIMIQRSIEANF